MNVLGVADVVLVQVERVQLHTATQIWNISDSVGPCCQLPEPPKSR